MRRDEEEAVSIVRELVMEGERGRGRPRRRWEDCIRKYMEMIGLKGEDYGTIAFRGTRSGSGPQDSLGLRLL